MTIRAEEQTGRTTAAVPAQGGPVEPPVEPAPVDHVRTHAVTCYWDFRECGWVCPGS